MKTTHTTASGRTYVNDAWVEVRDQHTVIVTIPGSPSDWSQAEFDIFDLMAGKNTYDLVLVYDNGERRAEMPLFYTGN